MEIIIISDSHGNISNFKFVMMFAKKIKAKAVIHCGDWDNLKTAQAALSFKLPLYAVLGNADTDTKIDNFLKAKAKRFEKNFLVFEIEGRRIGVIHNCQYLDSAIGSLNLDIVFCGHRHFKFQKSILHLES